MEYRNGTCGVDNNTRSKGRHMTVVRAGGCASVSNCEEGGPKR